MRRLYDHPGLHREVEAMFAQLSGHNAAAPVRVAELSVLTEEEMENLLRKEAEIGEDDNPSPVPTEAEAAEERAQEERIWQIADALYWRNLGEELTNQLRLDIWVFHYLHPEVKAWWEARRRLNEAKEWAKEHGKYGSKAWRAWERRFWAENRELWLKAKKAWATYEGRKATRAHDLLPKYRERLSVRWEDWKRLDPSEQEIGQAFGLLQEDWMPYWTVSGEDHWSIRHLSIAEVWYILPDLLPRRSWEEMCSFHEYWSKEDIPVDDRNWVPSLRTLEMSEEEWENLLDSIDE